MSADNILIDWLYQQTFKKRYRYPELRTKLEAARRFVLTDDMTAFLAEMVFESFQGRILKYRLPRATKRICQLLDNTRYFSRLPHHVTWVEFSEVAKWKGLKKIEEKHPDIPLWSELIDVDDAIRKHTERNTRVGWLLQQHDKIDTSFRCTHFAGNQMQCVVMSDFDTIWDTENDVVAWPIDPSGHSSERLTTTEGWYRPGVGECRTQFPKYASERNQHYPDLRYIWQFLSTVNKIPLVGESTIERSHGFVAIGSYHKFLSHKVISLNVPQKTDTRKLALKVLGDIIRRRAHQVRGHWRDDWHLPKGNKTLWIAEHQRGDASLGFVTHDYAVKHEES